ncbi:DVU_1556 family methyltransferase [Telmatospirillum sp.]|uniref:DVU_1556 family methyltransferase n=1 Tax=Telmatospirillum sp. TaxID=2079197 RepID=UPI00283E1D33|nr:class I SAM-dependent methyltransferase [Telmatospirillum sp.]MDR3439968.1 class I SAM-dependent methyltransferase [Telmatospirillum sp.]
MTPCPSDHAETPFGCGFLDDGAGQALRPGGSQLTARAVFCGAWQPGERVIDVGCGRGVTLDYLRQCGLHAIGIDTSAQALRLAKTDELSVIQASGDDLPFDSDSLDGVLAECSFSLLPDAAKALAEFHRVLRPGGRLVITDLYARNPEALGQTSVPPCLSGMLEKKKIARDLENVGFGVDTWEDHSDVLKAFLARFIFEYGSLDALWGKAAAATTWSDVARDIRPGYALLVARKVGA